MSLCGLFCCLPSTRAATQDLTGLSLEQLLNIDVTSVSRKEEKRNDASAAIDVITSEDILRSGATAIPDVLKLSPGLHVGRVDSNEWEVSSRGFSSVNSAKLLVLMDGRSVYTPLFSGVFWDVQDTDFEDIERIEVVRGPGGTTWGANAMNGVINILTKSAKDTQGTYADAGAGNEDRAFATLRHGGALGPRSFYRVYGKFFERDPEYPLYAPNTDGWRMGRVGLRTDSEFGAKDTLTAQGDVYGGLVGQISPSLNVIGVPPPGGPLTAHLAGGNVMATWQRTLGEEQDLQLRIYYDRTHRDDPTFIDDLRTYDVDFQNRLQLPISRDVSQEIIWGLTYRLWVDDTRGKDFFAGFLDPQRSVDSQYGGFVQDQLSIPSANLKLTVGSKFEQNSFSGFEVEPTGRFSYGIARGHTLWGAVSRAVRIPTRIERDVNVAGSPPAQVPQVRLVGNKELDSEKLNAFELGYRAPMGSAMFADVATFFNRYTDLLTYELGTPVADPSGNPVLIVQNENAMKGNSYGAEVAATYEPSPRKWKARLIYTFFNLRLFPEGADINSQKLYEGATPAHQVGVSSWIALSKRLDASGFLRYVGALQSTVDGPGGQGMPHYCNLDLRADWHFTESLDVSLVGQNLLHEHQLEYPAGVPIERAIYGKISGRF